MKNGENFKKELNALLKKYKAEIEAVNESDSNGYTYRTVIEVTLNSIYDNKNDLIQEFEVLEMSRAIMPD